ncbi:MAG: hypothetical protein OEV92_10075 [Nitrospinota bacterium]|nr:hypothetical protein [Nitrospinota bacterium]
MIQLLIYFGAVNALALAASLGSGYLGQDMFMAHFAIGFLSSLSCVLWICVAMFYFIYSGQAINRAQSAGLAIGEDVECARLAKKKLFPWFMTAMLLLVTGPFLGATAQAKTGPMLAHNLIGWISAAVYWYSLYIGRPFIIQTGATIGRILEKVSELRRAKAAAAEKNRGGF